MDSMTPKTHKKRYHTSFYVNYIKSYIFKMATGGHFGFMQISKIAQSCHLDNQAKFVQGPHGSTNPSKNFIVKNISRLAIICIGLSNGLHRGFELSTQRFVERWRKIEIRCRVALN